MSGLLRLPAPTATPGATEGLTSGTRAACDNQGLPGLPAR